MMFGLWVGFMGLAGAMAIMFWMVLHFSVQGKYQEQAENDLKAAAQSIWDMYDQEDFEANIAFLAKTNDYFVQIVSEKDMQVLLSVNNQGENAAPQQDDIVDEKYYPFKKFKVSHFNKKTTKRAISKSEMAKVLALDLSNITTYYSPLLYLSKDLFVFSYLGCGINMIDMAYLTYSNIIDDRICFKRHKTGQGITFRLLPQTIEIINKYKNEGYSLSDYIFPILDKKFHITEIQQYDRIRKVTKGVNRNLKKIGSFLGLNIPLTTYVARHSFATVLKRSGVNVAIISEALGHTSLSTTQFYLDSFDNEQIDDAMKNLL